MNIKIKSIMSFFLSLIVSFSFFVTPAYAYISSMPVAPVDTKIQQFEMCINSTGSNWEYVNVTAGENYITTATGKQLGYGSIPRSSLFFQPRYNNNNCYLKAGKGDKFKFYIAFNFDAFPNSKYSYELDNGDGDIIKSKGWTKPSGNDIEIEYTFDSACEHIGFTFNIYTNQNTNSNLVLSISDISCEVESASSSFFSNIGGWFSRVFEWLGNIRDNISNLASSIGQWFNDIGDRISGFFTNLINNIKTQFQNITDSLRTWFSNIGQWFLDIADSISGFFEKLWNRIYWGNENGASEYQKPVINNKLDDILDTLDGYQVQLKGTIDTIATASDDVSEYISKGSAVVTGILNVGGVGLTAVVIFGIVFVLVRKVVGR